jgi:hypothetical protein
MKESIPIEVAKKQIENNPPEQIENNPPEQIENNPPEQIKNNPPEQIENNPPEQIKNNPPEQIENNPPEQIENNPPEQIKNNPPEQIKNNPPEQTEIERLFDLSNQLDQVLYAHIYRLPNYELDNRTDSRAQREKIGKLPFTLSLEDTIQQKFGPGIYLIELKTAENRFYARLSTPIIIGGPDATPEISPNITVQPLSPFDEKLLHAQDKIFNTMLKMVDKINQPEQKYSEFELFEKFIQLQKNLSPKEEKIDEFTEIAKEMLKTQILNPPETPQIITDGENHWSTLFAPAIASLPNLAMAVIEYFNSAAKQTENQSKLETEKLKAELIRNNQQIKLERLRIERLRLEQSLQIEPGLEIPGTETQAVTGPSEYETENEQLTINTEQTAMNNQISELLEACKRNDSPEIYAEKIANAMNESTMVNFQIKPLLSFKPSDLIQVLNQYALEDLTQIPHAESWLSELQTQIKEKINVKK